MVVDDLELLNVAWRASESSRQIFSSNKHTLLHHDGQELHDDLGAGADEDLAFAEALSVDD